MQTELPSIVLDTNVLISAGLLPLSKTAKVVALAAQHFSIAQNTATWAELETRIHKKKFDAYFAACDENGVSARLLHLLAIARVSTFYEPVSALAVSRDPTDDKFVSLAVDAGAKIIVSGDLDLSVLGAYRDIEILTPAQFFDRHQPAA